MFIGHYGLAYAARGSEKRLPLWVYFVAVQWVDVVWTILIWFGIERVHIQPGANPSNPFVFDYYPYTHSLAAGIGWAALAYVVYRILTKRHGPLRPGGYLALAVLSHWFLDFLVHEPDLPLFDESRKVGLGLWNHPMIELAVELLLLTAGAVYYFTKCHELSNRRRVAIVALCVFMVAMQLVSAFGPPPPSVRVMAASGLVLYLLFALGAYLAEGPRSAARRDPLRA